MWVAAMIAVAANTDDVEKIILGGLAEIPNTSRLYESIISIIESYKSGISQKECFNIIHKKYDEHSAHGWCHTISNAMIVAASLLYGKGDFSRSICMAVEAGFDTDCNGATVGSILGMANGEHSIPSCWTEPINETLYTSIFGVGTVKISDCVEKTLNHLIG
jgi:ADP-ribosylglycohydrolase